MFLSPSLSSPSLSLLLRGPTFSHYSTGGASENSTFGTQTLMAMRKFLDDAELRSRQEMHSSQGTKKDPGGRDAECKEEDPEEALSGKKENIVGADELQQGSGRRMLDRDLLQTKNDRSQTEVDKEVYRAFRALFNASWDKVKAKCLGR